MNEELFAQIIKISHTYGYSEAVHNREHVLKMKCSLN